MPKTSTVDAALRITLAATWPDSTPAPLTSNDRNRSSKPFVISWLTLTAVVAEPKPAQSTRTPGTTYETCAVPVCTAPPNR